MVDHLIIKFKF